MERHHPTPKTPANSATMNPQPKPRHNFELPPKPLPVEISPFPVDFNQNGKEADEKCSTALGEVSPQTTDEGSRRTSKEPALIDVCFEEYIYEVILLSTSARISSSTCFSTNF